jgi:hypothetical protein
MFGSGTSARRQTGSYSPEAAQRPHCLAHEVGEADARSAAGEGKKPPLRNVPLTRGFAAPSSDGERRGSRPPPTP